MKTTNVIDTQTITQEEDTFESEYFVQHKMTIKDPQVRECITRMFVEEAVN
jgi:hypothetical protein